MDARSEFLIEMYRQMFNDINRHITVIWQSVGVVIGALAIFALIEKKVISADIAASIIILLCAWLFAHLADASYWYNRNLVIIANIERQFLRQSDLHDIQYYFGAHRPNNKMITHLKIQAALGVGLLMLVLLYHFQDRVVDGLGSPMSNFEPMRSVPYVISVAAIFYIGYLVRDRRKAYDEFVKNSPGAAIDASSVTYGVGHGYGGSGG